MKTKIRFLLSFVIPLLTALAIVAWGVFLPIEGEEMGYTLLNYYLLFPLVNLGCGVFLGTDASKWKWLYLPFAGLAGLLMPYPVFGTVGYGMAGAYLLISAAGVGIGTAISWRSRGK